MPISKHKLYRDDDINVYTDAFRFKELHEYFMAKGKKHIAAVVMKDLWENYALFYFLATAPLLDIGLHGWEHKDYSELSYEECYEDLKKSLKYWEEHSTRMTGHAKNISIFFAPWNKESDNIKRACKELGLKFCNKREGYWEDYYIKSFHFWNLIDGPIL
jgi:peptidoglycan/xylan/chitin deacetylase (PgdA/CDA1 family)